MSASDIFLGLIAILFPPLAVWIKTGICSVDSLINILLCCLGYLPGLLHAWYIIAKFPDPYEQLASDSESGRITYVYVQGSTDDSRPQRPRQQGYGTTKPMEAPPIRQEANGTWTQGEASNAGAGAGAPPPTYAQAVKGDHKIQTTD